MKRRIIFNGQEYTSPEAMPPDVRRAYEEALSDLTDIAQRSAANSALARALMPRAHSEHFLRAHYGARRTAAWMIPLLVATALGGMLIVGVWLLRPMNASGRGGDFSIGPGLLIAVALITGIGVGILSLYRRLDSSQAADMEVSSPDGKSQGPEDDPSEGLDAAQRTLGPMLAFMAGFVLVFATGLIFTIGGGQEHLAGRLAVAVPALLLLGWLDSYATQVARRRESLLGPDSPGYRQFLVWSGLGLLLSAAVLLGLALYLPS
jgi:hypothetical protein